MPGLMVDAPKRRPAARSAKRLGRTRLILNFGLVAAAAMVFLLSPLSPFRGPRAGGEEGGSRSAAARTAVSEPMASTGSFRAAHRAPSVAHEPPPQEHTAQAEQTEAGAGMNTQFQAKTPEWWDQVPKSPYYLGGLLHVSKDFGNKGLTTHGPGWPSAVRAVAEWMEYYRYAGLDHVWLYAAGTASTSALVAGKSRLAKYTGTGFLDFIEGDSAVPGFKDADNSKQLYLAAKDFADSKGSQTRWVMLIDIQEYITNHFDTKPGFLHEAADYMERSKPNMGQMLVPTRMFGGGPLADMKPTGRFLVELITQSKKDVEGRDVDDSPDDAKFRPIWKPANCYMMSYAGWNPRKQIMQTGHNHLVPEKYMTVNAYWEDLEEYKLAETVPDTLAADLATRLRKVLGILPSDAQWPKAE